MRIIDISQPLEDSMVYYPSLTSFKLNWLKYYSEVTTGAYPSFVWHHILGHI